MANLNEQTVSGTAYQRAYRVFIANPKDGTPSIQFDREKILTIGDEVISKPMDSLSKLLLPENYANEFPLLDPATGDEIAGEMRTFADVYQILYSLFIQTANVYDAAVAALNTPLPSE